MKKILILSISFLFLFSACNVPTYPKESMDQSLKELIKKESGIDSTVTIIGNTIYLDIETEGFLSSDDKDLQDAQHNFSVAVSNILRVVLSSDSNIKYMVVNAFTPQKNILYRYIQNIDDYKSYYYERISRDDYFSRNILELKAGKDIVKKIIDDKHEITNDEFAGRLIVADIERLGYRNPFLGEIIRLVSPEYGGISGNILTLKTKAQKIDSETKQILETAINNSGKEFAGKYKANIKQINLAGYNNKTYIKVRLS
ncbi:MAG: hypothetical protein LBQ37_03580 [Elusimicrobiota bacterium]|nr:hypothetical protein [Elusimicrobiota bacterium]